MDDTFAALRNDMRDNPQPNPHDRLAAEVRAVASAEPPRPRVTLSSPSLDWLMVILVQRWRWIIGATLVAGIGMLAAIPFLTPQYQIQASLLYKLGREQTPTVVGGNAVATTPFKRPEDVASEIEIIKSQHLIEDLVQAFGTDFFLARTPPVTLLQKIKAFARSIVRGFKTALDEVQIFLGLEKRLTPFEEVVSSLQASINAEVVKRADVLDITLLAVDQAAGVLVMNKLLELYLAEHIKVFRTPGAIEFLGGRVQALRADLARLEQARRDFNKQSAVWDLEEQRKMLLSQQKDVRLGLSKTREDLGRTGSEIAQAVTILATVSAEKRTSRVEQANPVAQNLQLRIVERRANLERLRLTFGDDSRRLADENQEIEKLEQLLAGSSKSVTASETFEVSSGYRDLERGLVEKRNRMAGLINQEQRQVEETIRLDADLLRLDQQSEEARRLQRDVALVDQSFQLYTRRLEEARISDALDAAEISNVAIIGRPAASVKPVKPRSKLLLLGALAAGLLGSIGYFLMRDAMRPVIHSRDGAAALLGVPVLARLPEVRR